MKIERNTSEKIRHNQSIEFDSKRRRLTRRIKEKQIQIKWFGLREILWEPIRIESRTKRRIHDWHVDRRFYIFLTEIQSRTTKWNGNETFSAFCPYFSLLNVTLVLFSFSLSLRATTRNKWTVFGRAEPKTKEGKTKKYFSSPVRNQFVTTKSEYQLIHLHRENRLLIRGIRHQSHS